MSLLRAWATQVKKPEQIGSRCNQTQNQRDVIRPTLLCHACCSFLICYLRSHPIPVMRSGTCIVSPLRSRYVATSLRAFRTATDHIAQQQAGETTMSQTLRSNRILPASLLSMSLLLQSNSLATLSQFSTEPKIRRD